MNHYRIITYQFEGEEKTVLQRRKHWWNRWKSIAEPAQGCSGIYSFKHTCEQFFTPNREIKIYTLKNTK